SAALFDCGPAAQEPLLALIHDRAAPTGGRALAALVLGAARRAMAESGRRAAQTEDPELAGGWPARSYPWGRRARLPPEPALVAALLQAEDGPALARHWERSLAIPPGVGLPTALLRELLAGGVPARRVVELAEAMAALVPVAERLLAWRLPPPVPSRSRRPA